jgi:hypothetical protein
MWPWHAPGSAETDATDLVDRVAGRIDVRPLQLCRQQIPAAEDVEQQVAVAVVVAVGLPALMVAVRRIVGRIGVQCDLGQRLTWASMETSTNCTSAASLSAAILAQRVGSGRLISNQFNTLAGQRGSHHRVMAQLVVTVQVLVSPGRFQ